MTQNGALGSPEEQFVSNLSHALRTPLAIVVGYGELLKARDDERTRVEAAERILDAAERLTAVVDDLLVVFALEADALLAEAAPVDLERALEDAIATVRRRSSQHTFAVRPLTNDGWPAVEADGAHVVRILINLLLNACRLSPEGCEIEVSIEPREGLASVTVSDSGFGLTEEQLRSIFDRFAPLEIPEHPEIRTTGLELYKARRLVELLGGTISAESEPGNGSRFTFTIPLANGAEAE